MLDDMELVVILLIGLGALVVVFGIAVAVIVPIASALSAHKAAKAAETPRAAS